MTKRFLMILAMVLWCNVGFAKILILKDCDLIRNEEVYEKFDIEINTSSKTILETRVYTDEFLNSPDRTVPISKISLTKFKLIYFDGEYAKGERFFNYKGEKRESELNIDIKNKTVQNFFTFYPSQERSTSKVLKCQ